MTLVQDSFKRDGHCFIFIIIESHQMNFYVYDMLLTIAKSGFKSMKTI